MKNVTFEKLSKKFPTEESAILFLEKKRWPRGPVCVKCGSSDIYKRKKLRTVPYRCRDCSKEFSIRSGTFMKRSTVTLRKWVIFMHMTLYVEKLIPVKLMAYEIDVSENTVRSMLTRIKTDMGSFF